MRKIRTVLCALGIVTMALTSTISAATTDELLNYFKSSHAIAGESVSLSAANVAKVERYLASNTVTEAQADTIIAKADEIISIMNKAGVSDPTKLSAADRKKALALANEAGAVIDVTVTYNSSNKALNFYKDGKLIDSAVVTNKLPFTGNNVLVYGIIGTVIVAAGAMFVINNKKGLALENV